MGFISEWQLTGFQFVVAVWSWLALVVAHAVWRAVTGAETDDIRPSGPIE